MNFRRKMTFGVPIVLASMMVTASANALFYNNAEELRDRTVTGDSFNAHLAREYQELVRFEWDKMYDWIDAENHATKGVWAADGKTPMPYEPAEWNIESEAELAELQSARTLLVDALNKGARNGAPALAAKAQAKYDCWVEQQEEGHQPDHIAACKSAFWTAMADLEVAMAPPKVAMKPEPKLLTTVSQEYAREVVYFDFDKAEISPTELAKIERFVRGVKAIKGAELKVVGHADRVGPGEYNQKLSAERAQSVTTKLIDEGMNIRELDDLAVIAEGETQPAIETADGVREALNRRVEIIAVGDVEVEQTASTSTTR